MQSAMVHRLAAELTCSDCTLLLCRATDLVWGHKCSNNHGPLWCLGRWTQHRFCQSTTDTITMSLKYLC